MTQPLQPLQGVSACVFDAYGTLFDSRVRRRAVRRYSPSRSARGRLTALWRDKQLQYTWLRTLPRTATPISGKVTGEALDFALDNFVSGAPVVTRTADGSFILGSSRSRGSRGPRRAAARRDLRPPSSPTARRRCWKRLVKSGRDLRRCSRRGDVGRRGSRVQDPSQGLSIRARHAGACPARAIAFQSSNAWDAPRGLGFRHARSSGATATASAANAFLASPTSRSRRWLNCRRCSRPGRPARPRTERADVSRRSWSPRVRLLTAPVWLRSRSLRRPPTGSKAIRSGAICRGLARF